MRRVIKMSDEINISQLTNSIMSLYEIYQKLEITDEVSIDNPAFDFICEIVDGIFNSCIDLMSLTYMHPDANPEMAKAYKDIISDINNQDDDFLDFIREDIFNDEDDLPLFE